MHMGTIGKLVETNKASPVLGSNGCHEDILDIIDRNGARGQVGTEDHNRDCK